MNKPTKAPRSATLRFRRFGPDGPPYEILEDSGGVLRIRVVETGEELDYPHARAERDPAA